MDLFSTPKSISGVCLLLRDDCVAVVAKNNEAVEAEALANPPVCITQHPGFQAVCLNRWALQTAWYRCKQQYRDFYEDPAHKQTVT